MRATGIGLGRQDGRAVVWILVVLVVGAAGFFIWQRTRTPKEPPSVIAVATPIPATPPPATPEPVIVKATPTPTPVVVVATPTPVPTPPPLELAAVVRTPALWPPQVILVQATVFPVAINGRIVGEAKVPVGTTLRLVRVYNQSVEVEYQNARQVVPVASTDLMQRASVTYRNNGYVLPQAPVAASAPVPTQVASTPAPNPADQVRVEVSADRKRLEFDPGKAVGEGRDSKSTEKYAYEVKVQNRTFGDVPGLDIQYLIFVERQKLGELKDKDTVERIMGTTKVEPLSRKTMVQTATTSEFTLTKQALVGDYYYPNGGRRKVADNVLGIWVKVLNEGKVIAEYTNPTTVVKRGWDKK